MQYTRTTSFLLVIICYLYNPKPPRNRVKHATKEQCHQCRRHDDHVIWHAEIRRRQVQEQLGAVDPRLWRIPQLPARLLIDVRQVENRGRKVESPRGIWRMLGVPDKGLIERQMRAQGHSRWYLQLERYCRGALPVNGGDVRLSAYILICRTSVLVV